MSGSPLAWLLHTRTGHLLLPVMGMGAGYLAGLATQHAEAGIVLGGALSAVLHAVLWRKV